MKMKEKRTIMSMEEINMYNQMINVGYPTDIIDIPDTIERRLFEIAGVNTSNFNDVPIDIVMCKTISIEDILLNKITPDAVLEKIVEIEPAIVNDMRHIPNRIKLFSNWKQSVDNINTYDQPQPIGAVMMECAPGIWIYKVFCLSTFCDSLMLMDGLGYKVETNKYKQVVKDLLKYEIIKDDAETKKMFCEILKLWYSVQIAMLNPITVDVFSRGERRAVVEHQETRKKKQKKTKIKYIRKHIIKPEEFDDAFDIKIGNNTFTRKTMIWHVAGHWREYKNGKKVFIDGYWKGPLKDIKNTDARERELVLSK